MKHQIILIALLLLSGCYQQTSKDMEKMTEQTIGTVELVVYKAKPEFTQQQMIDAAAAVNPIVEKFEGFISRKLSVSEDGTWADVIYWTDLESAKRATEKAMQIEACQYFFSMMEETDMQFLHLKPVLDSSTK